MARTNDFIKFMLLGATMEANANVLCLSSTLKLASYLILNSIYLGVMALLTVADVTLHTTLWKYKLFITIIAWAAYIFVVISTFSSYCYNALRCADTYLDKGIKIPAPSMSLVQTLDFVWAFDSATSSMALANLDSKINRAFTIVTKILTCIYALYIIEEVISVYLNVFGAKS